MVVRNSMSSTNKSYHVLLPYPRVQWVSLLVHFFGRLASSSSMWSQIISSDLPSPSRLRPPPSITSYSPPQQRQFEPRKREMYSPPPYPKYASSTMLTMQTHTRGTMGLHNLGNTCFMNAALQCLIHTTPLAKYFLENEWKRALNVTNVLGTGGTEIISV